MRKLFDSARIFLENIPNSGLFPILIKALFFITLAYFILNYIQYKLLADNKQNIKTKRIITIILKYIDAILGWLFILTIAILVYIAFKIKFEEFVEIYGFHLLILFLTLFLVLISEKNNLDSIRILIVKIKTFFDAIFLIEPEKVNDLLKIRLNVSNDLLEKEHELKTLSLELDKLRDSIALEKSLKYNGIYYKIEENFLVNHENLDTGSLNTILFILRNLENLKNRVTSEITRLIRFSRQNLQIGTGLSLIAIVFLFFSYNSSENNLRDNFKSGVLDLGNYLSFYFPKISIVILIEVIAFFFLRLYKKSILDIKKLQSEKTYVDFKIITLKLAIISKNEHNLTYLVNSSFSKSLSVDRIENEDELITHNQISDIIKELIKKIK